MSEMSEEFAVLKGAENIEYVHEQMVQAAVARRLTVSSDIDGTLEHGEPGVHDNVPVLTETTDLGNHFHTLTNGNFWIETGRPGEYTTNSFPDRKFAVGTEHGSVISLHPTQDDIVRVGNVEQVSAFREAFAEMQKKNPLIQNVQIEDYKEVSATLILRDILDFQGTSEQLKDLMDQLTNAVQETAELIVGELGASTLKVVPTVTPTNPVIEVMDKNTCKAEALQWMKDQEYLISDGLDVACGDSDGDKSMMDKVRQEDGICLGVSHKSPEAHVVFETPEMHKAFLWSVLAESASRNDQLKDKAPKLASKGFSVVGGGYNPAFT